MHIFYFLKLSLSNLYILSKLDPHVSLDMHFLLIHPPLGSFFFVIEHILTKCQIHTQQQTNLNTNHYELCVYLFRLITIMNGGRDLLWMNGGRDRLWYNLLYIYINLQFLYHPFSIMK